MPLIPLLGENLGLNYLQVGLVLSIFSLCQLFASPITGKLSDRFGRKPLLIFSQTSTVIGFLLLGIASNVWILIAARLVDGLLGSNMTVAQAYISDVTTPQQRTKSYSYSSAVFGAGLIFGPVIGGLLSTINYSIPMFFAVPSIIFIAFSISLVFKSDNFFLATSFSWALVIFPTLVLFGVPEPFSMPIAFFMSSEAKGDFTLKSYVLSS